MAISVQSGEIGSKARVLFIPESGKHIFSEVELVIHRDIWSKGCECRGSWVTPTKRLRADHHCHMFEWNQIRDL